jgi:hypothetical protein
VATILAELTPRQRQVIELKKAGNNLERSPPFSIVKLVKLPTNGISFVSLHKLCEVKDKGIQTLNTVRISSTTDIVRKKQM